MLRRVAQVFVGGQQKPSVRIQIDPARLVAKGLSLEGVRSQIAIATTDNPKGNIDARGGRSSPRSRPMRAVGEMGATLSRWMERRPEAEEASDEQKDAAE